MATNNTTALYTTVCDLCRHDGVVSVERSVPPGVGFCAYCGERITKVARWLAAQDRERERRIKGA